MRKIKCPLPEEGYPEYADAWIGLPDRWLGKHYEIRDEVEAKLEERARANGNRPVYKTERQLATALALLEDWGGIPELEGKEPDFAEMPGELIGWLVTSTLAELNMTFFRSQAVAEGGNQVG